MATSFNEVMDVKSFLRQQHIIVSEEWTEACISFLRQEQQVSSQNIKKLVHQQWLIADLEEIASPSLPQELPTAQKITLNGTFALQVQGIRDISRPAYSQLKELTNSLNTNAEFSSAPTEAVPAWEAKPTRMLMLALTDGCTQVQGMEYRTINFLSPNLSPGIKVLIKGPIECRFGVLLLSPENISILGGAVESKLDQFSRENLLKQQLQIETEDEESIRSSGTTTHSHGESSNSSRTSTRSTTHIHGESSNSSRTSTRNTTHSHGESSNSSRTSTRSTTHIHGESSNSSRTSTRNTTHSHGESANSSRTSTRSTTHSHGESSNSSRTSTRNTTQIDITQQNEMNSRFSSLSSNPSTSVRNNENIMEDVLDHFDSDDDFEQNIDYGVLDEIESSQRQSNPSNEADEFDPDVWQEDEDMVRDLMEFQDADPVFKMPFEVNDATSSTNRRSQDSSAYEVFTYLSTVINNPAANCVITIKGFIMNVITQLGCEPTGYTLTVKINDGTASVIANVHDKVLENIMGVSSSTIIKMKIEAKTNPKLNQEVIETVRKCKLFLQSYNNLMDVKFTPGEKPCIVKFATVSKLQLQQLLNRVSSYF